MRLVPAGPLARLVHKQPLAVKQKQRQTEGTEERFNGGKNKENSGTRHYSLISRYWLAAGLRGAQGGSWRML